MKRKRCTNYLDWTHGNRMMQNVDFPVSCGAAIELVLKMEAKDRALSNTNIYFIVLERMHLQNCEREGEEIRLSI